MDNTTTTYELASYFNSIDCLNDFIVRNAELSVERLTALVHEIECENAEAHGVSLYEWLEGVGVENPMTDIVELRARVAAETAANIELNY